MPALARFGRGALIVGCAIGYSVLAHYTNAARTETLGLAIAVAPLMLVLLSLAWNASHRKSMLLLFCIACAAFGLAWRRVEHHYSLVYWLEHAGTELALAYTFARTLRAGGVPLCTRFARIVHGSLSPALERYTRQVTVAWVWFFSAMAAASTLLFFAAPLEAWSVFSNFLTAPLIALMFVAEYAVRRRRHPDADHAGILDGIRLFWKAPAR
jgi:uncharacterized membrane protein